MTLPFRLLGFALRVIGSFFFVFALQIQFDGKTLESYLNNFGKKFVVTRTLQKVSKDSASALKALSSAPKENPADREPAGAKSFQYAKGLAGRFTLPETNKKKVEDLPE